MGYVGSSIAKHLKKNPINQISITSRYDFPYNLEWAKGIEKIQLDWNNDSQLQYLCSNHDVIIHAAGMNSYACAESPEEAVICNGYNTKKIVEHSSKEKIKTFIYISTAHVYDHPLVGKFDEESKLKNCHPYATSHVLGEQALLDNKLNKNSKFVVIRLSNAFGVPITNNKDCWNLVVNSMCLSAAKKNYIKLTGNGLEERDFISINEICHFIEYFILNNESSGIFNLGSGKSRKIVEVAKVIKAIIRHKYNNEIKIFLNNDTNYESNLPLEYDISKIRNTGYHFLNDFEKSLNMLIKFCKLIK